MKPALRIHPTEVCIWTGMIIFLLLTLYPMLHVVFASISQPALLMAHRGPILWPEGFSTAAYRHLFTNQYILSGLVSSAVLVIGGVLVNVVATAIAAYVLSKRQARAVKFFTVFVVFTFLFSGGLIPLYLTIRSYGLYNSYLAIILPFAISMVNLLILRTAFESLPASLEESARIDGAGHLTILGRIAMPLVMPTEAVIILYYTVDRWNGWFYASIFFKDRELYPLQLILREILTINESVGMMADVDQSDRAMMAESIKYAAIVLGTLPVLAVYPFLQRFFIKGSLMGAVKE